MNVNKKKCKHKNTTLIVLDAFDIHEVTAEKCKDCNQIIKNMSVKTRIFKSKIDGKNKGFRLTKKEVKGNYVHAFYVTVTGAVEVLELKCKIPEGYNDLDLETLKQECLTGEVEANAEALIK